MNMNQMTDILQKICGNYIPLFEDLMKAMEKYEWVRSFRKDNENHTRNLLSVSLDWVGSRAKGNFKPGSDIDMTIVADPTFDFSALAKVNTMFHESSLPYLYDISDFSKLTNPDLIEHIKRFGKVIYRNDNRIRLTSRGRSLCDTAGVPQRVAN